MSSKNEQHCELGKTISFLCRRLAVALAKFCGTRSFRAPNHMICRGGGVGGRGTGWGSGGGGTQSVGSAVVSCEIRDLLTSTKGHSSLLLLLLLLIFCNYFPSSSRTTKLNSQSAMRTRSCQSIGCKSNCTYHFHWLITRALASTGATQLSSLYLRSLF